MYKMYEVDPEADTLLIVPHYPARPFAPWASGARGGGEPLAPARPASVETITTTTTPSDVYAGILRGTSRPPNIYASITSSLAPPEQEERLRIKVSSRHLALASKYFRNRLRYQQKQEDDGRTHIVLPAGGDNNYDPQAVVTVMDILHGRGRRVPRSLPDVEALAKIAVVVDAFQVREAVEVYADRWVAGLLPRGAAGVAVTTDERELVLWIYASYVLGQADVFKAATRIAVLRSEGPIPSLGLHVREGVIREIESRRQDAIVAALDVVHTSLDALQCDESPSACVSGCDTFLLGALTQSLRRAKLPVFAATATARPAAKKPLLLGTRALDVSRAVRAAQDVLARQFAASSINSFGPPSWGLLPTATTTNRKRKTPNAAAPLTPESSPEPERGIREVVVHTCEAREGTIGAKLEELERGVEGLDLEGKLGYYLY